MNCNKLPFTGAAAALITPFHPDGSLDLDALGRLIEFQIDSGTDAIVVLGTTGESSTLTDSERRTCIEFAAEKVGGRVPLIVGTGTNRTAYSVELSKFARECGCDALLVVTPYYNKATDTGLMRHFSTIADAADCPVIIYNIPSRTGVNIPIGVYRELASHPQIVGVKEASGNISYVADIFAECGDSLAVYSGNDDQTMPIMSMGGCGVISVLSNIMPRKMGELAHLALDGHMKEAAELQRDLHGIMSALFYEVNPIPVKTACGMMGFCGDTLRLPLCEMSENNRLRLRAALEKYGLI